MKKSKKKIVIFLITVITLIVAYNPLKSKGATNVCVVTEDYYFMEALSVTANSDGTYTASLTKSSNDTTFKTPSGTFDSISISSPRDFTVADCENYYANYENRTQNNIPIDDAYCYEGTCTNSGNGDPYVNYNNAVSQSSCSSMVNNQINADDIDLSWDDQAVSGSDEVSVTIDREFIVTAEQAENFYVDESGQMWLFQPVAVTVEMTYETSEECKNKPEKPEVECVGNSGDSYSFSGCGGSSHSATISSTLTTESYTSSYNTAFQDEALSARFCPSSIVKEKATATVNFTQNGSLSVFMDSTKYSGGGVTFSFNYSTSATWEYCGDQSEPSCSKEFYYPSCASDGYTFNQYSGKCEKVVIEETCDEYVEGSTTECAVEWETTRKTLREDYVCEEKRTTGYSPERCSDQAETKIYEEAGEKIKSISSPSVESYDSNSGSTNRVSLLEEDRGKVSVSSPSGGAWPVGTTRSGSIVFSINQACINIYSPFDVKYYGSGECPENRIDGGTKYYIPLKWPENKIFKFWASSSNVSIIQGMNWDLSFDCGVNCEQKLYENPPDDLGYKFIYRPIDLNDPFPTTINPNRQIGSNWQYFMSQEQAKTQELTRDNLEYHAVLTKDSINKIKNQINNTSYATLNTISPQGKSSVLDEIDNLLGLSVRTSDYNNLGECTDECW